MKVFRMILQVGVFLFLAGYFLMLVAARKTKLGDYLPVTSSSRNVQTQGFKPKPSPIEMMRKVDP